MEEPSRLPEGYSLGLQRGEPDLLILKRPDGSSVVAFEISGLRPDPDRIMQIAAADAEVSERSAPEDLDTQDSRNELSEAPLRERMRDKAHLEEVGRRAWEIYEQSLSYELEPEHVGQFVVVDVTTGDYFLSDTTHAGFPISEGAFEKAEASNPSGKFFLMKVGYRAAYGTAGHPKRLQREQGDPRAE